MKTNTLITAFIFIIVFMSGCSPKEPALPVVSKKPSWFFTPSQEGGIGGVGVSGAHVKGRFAQRELAISRAIDEIARQMGVNVSNVLRTSAEVTGSTAKTSLETYSIQTSDGKTVKATIRDIWMDPLNDTELYVWMIAK